MLNTYIAKECVNAYMYITYISRRMQDDTVIRNDRGRWNVDRPAPGSNKA